jgi:hypothetical protein
VRQVGIQTNEREESNVDVIGFVFGLLGFVIASSARAQVNALKQEVEALKAAQQNRSE